MPENNYLRDAADRSNGYLTQACGQVSLSAIFKTKGRGMSANEVTRVGFAYGYTGWDLSATGNINEENTSPSELSNLAGHYGYTTQTKSFDRDTIIGELQQKKFVIALIKITDAGVITKAGWISHWVVINGISEDLGNGNRLAWVYNPFNNEYTYLSWQNLQNSKPTDGSLILSLQ